jgi:hypothetical protein
MNWYYTVEKELARVRNAIQVLDLGRGQFRRIRSLRAKVWGQKDLNL